MRATEGQYEDHRVMLEAAIQGAIPSEGPLACGGFIRPSWTLGYQVDYILNATSILARWRWSHHFITGSLGSLNEVTARPQRPELQRLSPVHDAGDDEEGRVPEDPWAAAAAAAVLMPPTPAGLISGTRDGKYVDYKVDPAPSWGGDLPEKNCKEYIRNMKLWLVEAEARLAHNLIGKRIIDSVPLVSKLSASVAHPDGGDP